METVWRPGQSTTMELELFAMLHAYQSQIRRVGPTASYGLATRAVEEAETYETFVSGRQVEIQTDKAIFRSAEQESIMHLGSVGLMGTFEESYVNFDSEPCSLGVILDADIAYQLATPANKSWHGARSFVPISSVNLAILK